MKNKTYQLLMLTSLAAALIIFSIITLNAELKSETIQNALREFNSEDLFIQLFRSENHLFFPAYEKDYLSFGNLSEIFLKLATNIKPTDVRSFLVYEIPGLKLYDKKIVVEGEDAHLATFPYESPPPLGLLLEEKEVKEENLSQNFSQEQNNNERTLPENTTVFVYHTHNLESFFPLLKDTSKHHEAISSDERANVIAVGKRLSNNLIRMGIGVEHNKTNINEELLKRNWKYAASYQVSNEVVETAVSTNPNLKYFIDIHRDSARKETTTQYINGIPYAKIYFVIGTEHENYQKNLEFARKINSELVKRFPGISRGVSLKTKKDGNGIYNQHVSDKAILIELGGVDNNLEELGRTTDAFSEVFANIYWEENGGSNQ